MLYSILDLSPILPGSTAGQSYANTMDLARFADDHGFHRYWLAEHHNIPGIGSAATSVLVGYVASGTKRIRVGSGGIMLPNHAPLVIAEQFGTLESLYPGRIDLGLGRAPGGDQTTARALRKNLNSHGGTFPEDFAELRSYFAKSEPGQAVRAIPGEGLNVPFYILGSSDFGAQMAAREGLPFAFASHFAPDYLQVALELYRSGFRPSTQLAAPHVMVGVNVFAAATDAEASRLFTSLQQTFLNLIRGAPRGPQAPVDSMAGLWSAEEEAHIGRMTRCSVVGSPATIRRQFQSLIPETAADEFILTAHVFDHVARKKSLGLAAEVLDNLGNSQLDRERPATT